MLADKQTVVILLTNLHVGIQTPTGTEDSWQIIYAGHVMQFFCLVYHMYSQDSLWYNSDFLQALALVVFPLEIPQVRSTLLDYLY